MDKLKQNYKIICMSFFAIIIVALIIYALVSAFSNHNSEDVKKIDELKVNYNIGANQLDSLKLPDPKLKITTDELPKTTDTLTDLNIKTIKDLFITSKKSILVLVKDNCSFCNEYVPRLTESLNKLNIKAYKINITNFNQNDINTLSNYIDFEGTPTTYIIENGKATHSLTGTVDNETIDAFIDYYYVRSN